MWRRGILEEIERLDPVKDHERIVFLDTCWEFSWDTARALELALFRTFAVAKSTPLLASTGEFTLRTQKRYDDTVLLLAQLLEHGYDSQRGRAALRRMNQLHRRYQIPNDEYQYVLSTFVLEPIRWNARFGWRRLTEAERQAAFIYWREVGRRMGIRDIPESLEALERFNLAFEREHFRYAPTNHQLAIATRDLFLSWVLPRPLWRLGAPVVHALMDDRLLDAVGLPRPPRLLRWLVEGALRVRARVLRLLPRPRHPRLPTRMRTRTYPHGYRIEELGPP